jgi:hypothetical protein
MPVTDVFESILGGEGVDLAEQLPRSEAACSKPTERLNVLTGDHRMSEHATASTGPGARKAAKKAPAKKAAAKKAPLKKAAAKKAPAKKATAKKA